MKRKYIIVSSLTFLQFFSKAQVVKDTNTLKVSKTAIELVYNHYLQDGENSAVTGGIGTEKLTVYGPSLTVKNINSKSTISFNLGADIISSASTDKIDFVVSSASSKDARVYANTSYTRNFPKKNLSVFGGTGFSIESDYFSIASKLGFTKNDKQKLRTFSGSIQVFNDDLRWGRVNPGYYRPAKLIYPAELRFKEWYNVQKRNSYNLKLGFSQVINKRNILGLYPEFTYQKGLLATPFHRIFFSDGSLAVENLPNQRKKAALALKWNTFYKGEVIFKNTINNYIDDFGIVAFSIENETAIKLKHFLTLLPNFRFYTQQASKYFASYGKHSIHEQYFTSDFDLSLFETYTVGLGIKYSPQKYLTRKMLFNTLVFRYNYLYRSNNLSAHFFSIALLTEFDKKNN